MSLQAAVLLANTALEPDTLTTVAELDEFFATHEYSGRHEQTAAELEEVRALRPVLRELMLAERDDAVEMVNTMLADAGAVPRLVRHEPYDWHVHAIAADAALVTRITVETAMAMIDVIRADEMSRFGRCEAADCEGVVIDLSRNRSRKYCSTACTNREAVAAYRSRQRA